MQHHILSMSGLVDLLKMIIPAEPIRSAVRPWFSAKIPNVSLDAAGLVALADLRTITQRTVLTGTSALLDVFVLCPGLHQQQSGSELNGGEYPAVAAMTTGYVFRVENPATVHFLQQVSLTGQLTSLTVTPIDSMHRKWSKVLSVFYTHENATLASSMAYLVIVCMTSITLAYYFISRDWWGAFIIVVLMLARLCNILVIRRRNKVGWKGAREPGVQGDLLVLLSQDRWVRLRGAVDDLKAVTSGQWLRDMTFVESSLVAIATVLVYLDAALVSNVTQVGKIILLALLMSSAGLLAIVNKKTKVLQMHGNLVKIVGAPKRYNRRLDMVNQLVEESGRRDWAIGMGLIVPKPYATPEQELKGPVTM